LLRNPRPCPKPTGRSEVSTSTSANMKNNLPPARRRVPNIEIDKIQENSHVGCTHPAAKLIAHNGEYLANYVLLINNTFGAPPTLMPWTLFYLNSTSACMHNCRNIIISSPATKRIPIASRCKSKPQIIDRLSFWKQIHVTSKIH